MQSHVGTAAEKESRRRMRKILECVPNFSEGRNRDKIERITSVIKTVDGVRLLHVDSGEDTNRTVVTMAGSPEQVVEAAFLMIQTASEQIDMRQQSGVHPRMGATDVCPLIPVSGILLEECVSLAIKLGERVGEELGIPVYLYGKAARTPERMDLPDIRRGGYESLPRKLQDPTFSPDFGPIRFNAKSGATAVGVREFMLAYNINLKTKDAETARLIAGQIRESGQVVRYRGGRIVRNGSGQAVRRPGKLKFCQADGWVIETYGHAQVTMNLHNYKVTGMHTAYEAVKEEADKHGTRVTGSELIGMVPLEALLDAGRYYLQKEGQAPDLSEPEIVNKAIESLGLNDTAPFLPGERVLEYVLGAG